MMRAAVSVDLDPLGCYHAIHGLAPPPVQPEPALVRWLPRFVELFAELDVRATFFVVGHALAESPPGAAALRTALAAGHELGNHSFAHPYDLVRHGGVELRADLERCDRELRGLGAEVVGFRAPGYTHDDALLTEVARLGYRYDSSALPSPGYYAAKLAVIAWHRLRGRRSQSQVRGARSFFGPTAPHRRGPLWELPISTLGPLRLPLVGTFLLAGPAWLRARLVAGAVGSEWLHLELHGIDLADPGVDGIDPRLVALQPELRTPLATRRERLREFLRARSFAPLRDHC